LKSIFLVSVYIFQCFLVKLPFPLRQLVWSRYLERERGISSEVHHKIGYLNDIDICF